MRITIRRIRVRMDWIMNDGEYLIHCDRLTFDEMNDLPSQQL